MTVLPETYCAETSRGLLRPDTEKRGINDEYFDRFNYENYGGTAPILGVNGYCNDRSWYIECQGNKEHASAHGRSDRR